MSLTPRLRRSVNTRSQNLAPSVCSIHSPSTSRVPSRCTPKARYTALLWTTPSARILTRSASKNTSGYTASSGRPCQAATSSSTASVTRLTRSGETSTAYICCRCCWISRTLIPRAYIDTILSSKPAKRRECLGTSCGSNEPARSRGISSRTAPSSVSTVLPVRPVRPLRWLPGTCSASRWASSSAFNARSRKAFLNPRNTASNPSGVIGPGTSCSSSSGRIVTAACASTPVPGAFFLAMACSSCLKSRPCTQKS